MCTLISFFEASSLILQKNFFAECCTGKHSANFFFGFLYTLPSDGSRALGKGLIGLRLMFGFEHLVCNVWWTMLVCATLIYLCSSCGCEVVLTLLKFISYIYCILYASISTCRENSVKSFKYIYVCTWYSCKFICTYQGEFSLLIELGEFIHTIFWNFQEKWVSSSKVQFQVHLMISV